VTVPFLMTAAIFLAHWLVSKLWGFNFVNRILAVSVLTILQIVLSQLALGVAGVLTAFSVQLLNSVIILLLVTFVLSVRRTPQKRLEPFSPQPSTSDILGLLLVAAVYGFIAFLNNLNPPYEWDALTYHLVDVLFYAQNKTVDLFPFPGPHFFFPKLGELLTLWLYLLAGADSVAFRHLNIVQATFAMLGGAAVISAAHSLGLRKGMWISVPLYALTPIAMIQSLTAMVDLMAGSIFLTTLAFLLLFLKTRYLPALRLAVLSWGILLGIKLTFLYFSLPLIFVLIFGRPRIFIHLGHLLRPKWRNLGILIVCFTLGCGFWFARNLIWFGNPFYPNLVRLGGQTLFQGPFAFSPDPQYENRFVQSPTEWVTYPFMERAGKEFIYSFENGFGPQFVLGLICSVWAAIIAFQRKKWMVFWTLLCIPLLIALWFYPHPFRSPRYIIAVCGLAVLGLIFICETGGNVLRRWLVSLAWISILFSVIATAGVLAPEQARALQVFKSTGRAPSFGQYYGWFGLPAEPWEWFAQYTSKGEGVTFTNSQLILPLLGWENQNRLVWVSPPEYYPYLRIPHARNYSEWRALLKEKGASLLYRVDFAWNGKVPPRVVRWIENHPSDFQLIKSWNTPHFVGIYRIIYTDQTLQDDANPEAFSLEDLNRVESWSVSYEENARLTLLNGTQNGGIGFRWSFNSVGNDYVEAVAYPSNTDWQQFKYLSFSLYQNSVTDLLYIYLKNSDPREAARFRVTLADLEPGRNAIQLDLRAPERKSPGFSLNNVNSIHLIIDDEPDSRIGSGAVEIMEFQGLANPKAGG
jgi:hypothetical protein